MGFNSGFKGLIMYFVYGLVFLNHRHLFTYWWKWRWTVFCGKYDV